MAKSSGLKKTNNTAKAKPPQWIFRLYAAGKSEKALAAYANLKSICESYLTGKYVIEVIDLVKNPELCKEDNILAIPTIVRRKPLPVKKVIGDMTDRQRAINGLEIKTR